MAKSVRDRASGGRLLEEIVTFVVDQDECREIVYLDLPDRFHPKLRKFHYLDALDVFFRQDRRGTPDAPEIKATMLFARGGHLRSSVAFRDHDHAATLALEKV